LNDQDFVASVTAESEDLIAFDRDRVLGFVGIERRFAEGVTTGAGVQVERTHIVEDTGDRTYTLSGLPLFARRDAVDDLLDPTRGNREALTVTPYVGELGSDLTFVSSRLSGSAYHRFDDKGRFVLAGFAALGSIVGESRDALPEDKRLYAGGGGSVRGYGFQRVGPLDADGEPIGGRSSIELGLELRVRVTETIGVVPFIEAGNVYEPSFPDLGSGLLYGAGLGFRYYTPIGPVRLDIAVPLDRRPSDDPFQIYISLGQAF
jgi:translocation and assembly module TamA